MNLLLTAKVQLKETPPAGQTTTLVQFVEDHEGEGAYGNIFNFVLQHDVAEQLELGAIYEIDVTFTQVAARVEDEPQPDLGTEEEA